MYNGGFDNDLHIDLHNVVFEDNDTFFFGGGAIFNEDSVDVEILASLFRENRGNNQGGAIVNRGSAILFLGNVEFEGNFAQNVGEGGAIYAVESSTTIACVP